MKEYYDIIFGDKEIPATLNVCFTYEGIVADVVDDNGNMLASWCQTAQEIADNLVKQ